MAVHKLSITDFNEIDYSLLAIHTSLEDYRLAYFLNQKLSILLSNDNHLVECSSTTGTSFFSTFEYQDELTGEEWVLIENKDEQIIEDQVSMYNLFAEEKEKISTRTYLLPELKKVSFFLKITNITTSISELITQINTIPKISTAYVVEVKNLKSKNNLIF